MPDSATECGVRSELGVLNVSGATVDRPSPDAREAVPQRAAATSTS